MSGITDETLRKTIEKLDAVSGGSLVKHLSKLELTPTKSLLYIGLGGLGSETINALKSVYTREYAPTQNVRFLAVDTCTDDQEKLKYGSDDGGCLASGELFQIYDNDAISLLTRVPRDKEIEDWIGALPAKPLNSLGAMGVRQIGRVMLCGTDKYEQLRSKISNLVGELKDKGAVNVFIIAGISGGTGSGTFIDVSYMVRDILDELAAADTPVMQWGVFYTPEAQHSVRSIASKPDVWNSLKRNGYAALKELDYFLSNGDQSQVADPIYTLSIPGGRRVQSGKPIFDPGRVFLISGNRATRSYKRIVDLTARGLLNIFRRNQSLTGAQDFTATASNMDTYCGQWRLRSVGKDGQDTDQSKANIVPLGIYGSEFPAFMNFQYLSQGFSSVYFPRDEIMAYCANRAMKEVFGVWKDASNVSQSKVMSLLKTRRIESIESVEEEMLARTGVSKNSFFISSPAYRPDITKYILGRGKVENTSKSIRRAEVVADDAVKSFNNDGWIRSTADALSSGLIVDLSSERFVATNGPFACIAALTGYGSTRGACQLLEEMRSQNLSELIREAKEEAETQRAIMHEAASRFEADKTPTDAEEQTFLESCRDFSVARFRQGMLTAVMPKVLEGVRSRLLAFNNTTFATYVPVMEALAESLNRDSTIFAGTERARQGLRETFGMDAYGLDESEATQKRFTELFDGYINFDRVGSVARGFARMMFGQGYGKRWAAYKDDPEQLAAAVREAFSNFFRPFANDILEKFAVLAYCGDEGALGELTPKRLDQIWIAKDGTADAELRDGAIAEAGKAIAEVLLEGGAPLIELEASPNQMNKMYRHVFVTLIDGMDRLNDAILEHMGDHQDYGYADGDTKSVARCVSYVGPLSLAMIKGMSSWAKEYLASESSAETKPGRHLDERSQDWARLLPEPFGMDADAYWVSYNSRPDLNVSWPREGHDLEIFDLIREALEKGISAGYVFFDDGPDDCYKLISDVREHIGGVDLVSSVREAANIAFERNGDASLRECLMVARDEPPYTIDFDEVKLSFPSNGPLNGLKKEVSDDPAKYNNLCRIVRSSMNLTRAVLNSSAEYYGSANRDSNGVLESYERARRDWYSKKKYETRLPLFIDMLLLGMLEYQPGVRAGMGEWRFMSEADERWDALCDFTALQRGFETEITLYLAFSKGLWNLSDEDCDWISNVCASRRRALKLISDKEAQGLRASLVSVLDSDSLRMRRKVEERDIPLLDMVMHSEERAYYNTPMTVVDGSTVYANITSFYQSVIDTIDRTNF